MRCKCIPPLMLGAQLAFHLPVELKVFENLEVEDVTPKVPLLVIKEQELEVEQILALRILRGKLQYQMQWKGCDPDQTWYPAHGFKGAPYKIQNFHGSFLDQPGPPKRLAEWLESWESGQGLEDIPDDDLPE